MRRTHTFATALAARRMLARLSNPRVAKLQIAATAAIGTQTTTFTLGARR